MELLKLASSILILLAMSPLLVAAFSARQRKLFLRPCCYVIHDNRFSLALNAKKDDFDDSIFGPFEEGKISVSRKGGEKQFSLYFRIYNTTIDGGTSKPPLVIVHGGPSLPSQYLYPMVPNLKQDSRPIVFYDQLGCGKSEEPKEKRFYSMEQSVADLDRTLQTLGYGKTFKVHLFGHSWGGCVAFEYAKKHPNKLQSLILSNAPVNMKAAGDEYDRLALQNPLGFWNQRVCSVDSPALDNALQNVGHVWAGMDVVLDYKATPPSNAAFPTTLVITCTNDFVGETSREWTGLLNGVSVEEVCIEGCAHYPHLEKGETYGRVLDDFLSKNDG